MTKLEEKLIELGYERYNDTYNFGKIKGNSTNTNVVTKDVHTHQAFNEMQKDLEVLKKYEDK